MCLITVGVPDDVTEGIAEFHGLFVNFDHRMYWQSSAVDRANLYKAKTK